MKVSTRIYLLLLLCFIFICGCSASIEKDQEKKIATLNYVVKKALGGLSELDSIKIFAEKDTLICKVYMNSRYPNKEWCSLLGEYLELEILKSQGEFQHKYFHVNVHFPKANNVIFVKSNLNTEVVRNNLRNPARISILNYVLNTWGPDRAFNWNEPILNMLEEMERLEQLQKDPVYMRLSFLRMIEGVINNCHQSNVDPEMMELLTFLIDELEELNKETDVSENLKEVKKILYICEEVRKTNGG